MVLAYMQRRLPFGRVAMAQKRPSRRWTIVPSPLLRLVNPCLLRGPAGEEDLHHVDQLFLRVQVTVLLRQVERVAERLSARDDRHLVHRHGIAHQVRHDRVPGLMVGQDPLLLLADDA